MTFGLVLGQGGPDQTKQTVLLQDKRRGAVTSTRVTADEAFSGKRRENQEASLRRMRTDVSDSSPPSL